MGTSSDENMPEAFPDLVRRVLPTASNTTIAAIEAHFPYPADNPAELAWDYTTAMAFECNAYNIANSFKDKTHRYIMSIPPATHGQDVLCMLYHELTYQSAFQKWYVSLTSADMFYSDDVTTPVANVTTALQYQTYIRQFVSGNAKPYLSDTVNATNLAPDWPVYGQDSRFFNISLGGFVDEVMPASREESCNFLNQVTTDPVNGA